MRLIPKGLSIRYYISALLIAVSALGLILAWSIHRRTSELDLRPPPEEAEREGGSDLGELERLFQEQPGEPGRYGVIADKNLFSEQRRAAADETAPQAGPGRPAADRGQEVQLLGTSILGKRKSAMLRFLLFQGQDKVRIAEEGQTVRDKPTPDAGAGARQAYTVKLIEERRVTLTDQSGQSFTVSLAEPDPVRGRAGGDQAAQTPREGAPEEENLLGSEPEQPTRSEARQRRPDGDGLDAQARPPSPEREADNTGAGTWARGQ